VICTAGEIKREMASQGIPAGFNALSQVRIFILEPWHQNDNLIIGKVAYLGGM
jgi:hypothetical protein